MKVQNQTYFVLIAPSGKLVGVDQNSGGYPFETDYLSSAILFLKRDLAESYNSHFTKNNYEVKEATVSFE